MDTQSSQKDALTYEETPPIEPIKEPEPDIFPPPKPNRNSSSVITTIIIFILLFVVGFWLSGIVRKYAGNFFGGNKEVSIVPTPSIKESVGNLMPTTAPDTFGTWKTYPVVNGRTRVAYEGISFKLPPEVLTPICDGSSCQSQGTYLPGGTRFTVALRGVGQVLPDFRGKIISDLKGVPFTAKETMIKGITATEFEGLFTGTTVSGYVFSRMHGFMIPVTDTVSLEINHFTPSGIVADFVKDDALFDEIMKTLILPISSLEKGGAGASGSPSATPIIGE
jgi:hypothetical protein